MATMKDSKRRLIERLKVTRKSINASHKLGEDDGIIVIMMKNQVAIMESLTDDSESR